MGFAILRTQKLKSPVAVQRSMKHALREQDTPNADPAKTPDNTHFGAQTVADAIERFNARLPDKRRKDAVLCIEYLVTASPAEMASKSRSQQDAYMKDALKWLEARHGAENVVYAGIHRDETTPHLYAYVVPRDGEGLNCRKWLGGSKALSEMQTEFAQTVGRPHGLERGIERSKARHVPIREYYARVNEPVPELKEFAELPEPKLFETKRSYGQRTAESVRSQLTPVWKAMNQRVSSATMAADNVQALKRAVQTSRHQVESAQLDVKVNRELSQRKLDTATDRIVDMAKVIAAGGWHLEMLRAEILKGQRRDIERGITPERGLSMDR